jgi:hypothetical protein
MKARFFLFLSLGFLLGCTQHDATHYDLQIPVSDGDSVYEMPFHVRVDTSNGYSRADVVLENQSLRLYEVIYPDSQLLAYMNPHPSAYVDFSSAKAFNFDTLISHQMLTVPYGQELSEFQSIIVWPVGMAGDSLRLVLTQELWPVDSIPVRFSVGKRERGMFYAHYKFSNSGQNYLWGNLDKDSRPIEVFPVPEGTDIIWVHGDPTNSQTVKVIFWIPTIDGGIEQNAIDATFFQQ